jgi:hypothetical protein
MYGLSLCKLTRKNDMYFADPGFCNNKPQKIDKFSHVTAFGFNFWDGIP